MSLYQDKIRYMTDQDNGNGQSAFRKYLTKEVAFVIVIAGAVFWIINFVQSPNQINENSISEVKAQVNQMDSEYEDKIKGINQFIDITRGDINQIKGDIRVIRTVLCLEKKYPVCN